MQKLLKIFLVIMIATQSLTACQTQQTQSETNNQQTQTSSNAEDSQNEQESQENDDQVVIQHNGNIVTGTSFMLDTNCAISIYDDENGIDYEEVIRAAFARINELEEQLSWKIKTSEISKINRKEIDTLSPEAETLFEEALEFAEKSHGVFDITVGSLTGLWNFSSGEEYVPTQEEIDQALTSVGYQNISLEDGKITFKNKETLIDLGGIAKGYIADKVKEVLVENKIRSAIINLGGNVLCLGDKGEGKNFVIGIQYPFHEGYIITLEASPEYCSIVTSGTYERSFEKDGKFYHHILDTKTGYPIDNNLVSVSILSERGIDGDTLSTTCFALGIEEGMKLINSMPGVHAVFIDSDDQLYYSDNFEQDITVVQVAH